METWLENVKRVRIPRPKFGSTSTGVPGEGAGASGRCCYPMEPPKDYQLPYDEAAAAGQIKFTISDIAKATEELRRALQEKL